MPTARQVLTIGGISVLTAGISYCFYFDYKRRNDPAFRKKLREYGQEGQKKSSLTSGPTSVKEQRRLSKQKQASNQNASREAEQLLSAAVAAVNAESLPTSIEGKENYFMEQVGMGEMLAGRLPQGTVPAAISFFKAYKVYPSPQELMMIYQRTMPAEVFAIVVEMIKLDVNQTIRSSQASTAASSRNGLPSGGALIEELTAEEKAALKAQKPDSSAPSKPASKPASSPPTRSSSKPDPAQPVPFHLAPSAAVEKPTSSEPDQSKAAENSSITPAAPATDLPKFQPNAMPSLPRDESPKSTAASEHGSGAGGSQTANSFVLVEDPPANEAGPLAAPEPVAIKEDSWVDDGDEKDAHVPENVPNVQEEAPDAVDRTAVGESPVVEAAVEKIEVAEPLAGE